MKNLLFTIISLFLTINVFSQCENDSINPYFVNLQIEPTVDCGSDLSLIFPIALDECDDSVEIAYYEEVLATYCPNSYDLFRVYRAFDDNGNQSVETQIIHVVDEIAPSFTQIPTSYLSCLDSVVFDSPEVMDNCSSYELTFEDIIEYVDSCNTNYLRLWTAVDECGNVSNMIQTIVVSDTVPPSITGPLYLEVNQGDNIDSLFVTVTDDCHSFTVSYRDSEVSGNNIIRDYTATDYCGNVSTFEQIIHIIQDDNGGGNNHRVAICHREEIGRAHV